MLTKCYIHECKILKMAFLSHSFYCTVYCEIYCMIYDFAMFYYLEVIQNYNHMLMLCLIKSKCFFYVNKFICPYSRILCLFKYT